ncbi:adenosylcobinamide kinase/adenosylcobinamide-phosphate guanylyltransferase [Mycolicibacterium sp. BK556]|uniref:bifunctional adenosylcobinamide kinase/adenosylcobinamide-phosphate guanylyltransferase n=1 Tax=unclassified Mycolicibacterium TaxID=2636767 RepID=UPI001622A88E|nr:adenosylcobinamide kinase/adenosylcobinamide-phosphate guanylyltransferase [Mycolicibacterium sp. BK556]MBB3633652.1 adenosylcobinamide kinase/adenosylcobinamide-phosphate guanylyltransferase [Mycolicibacterium sp. BK607]MBB3751234.1 adenosylcobinamide kinase/adenosylcobinamide-phosphate guanylyltransferase [Mycolicibacterium sp. BK634]
MRTLVLGGIRSGKSRWAETAIAAEPAVRYVATGAPADTDAAWAQRVAAHRDRRPDAWSTVETSAVAALLRDDPQTATLIDDLGGWLTAALDRRGWENGSVAADVDDLVSAVDGFTAPLVVVSPEVGLTVVAANAAARRFTDELGTLNQRLAQCCEQVVLVVAGLPVWVKPTKALN